MEPAIFLDRDGVIIENRDNYVRSWQDVAILPYALEALAQLSLSAFKIVMVTNQSAVGRGLVTLDTVQAINHQLLTIIEQASGRIDSVQICPHAPEAGCNCRKPLPGLLLDAAAELKLDLSRSWMIGDALSDIQAGKAAGVTNLALVLTGRGRKQLALAKQSADELQFDVYENLADFVAKLCANNDITPAADF